jgi:hypothetical protein
MSFSAKSTVIYLCVRREYSKYVIAIYGPMLYTAPYVMLLMRANPLRGQVHAHVHVHNMELFIYLF